MLAACVAIACPAAWAPPSPEPYASTALEQADEALRRGDLVEADLALRQAWTNDETRRIAARALGSLHKLPGFKLTLDESGVNRTERLLGPRFHRHETSHFIVLSDCDARWTRERGHLLERTRHQFFRVARRLDTPVIPHRHKLLCVLFDRHADYMTFARQHDGVQADWIAGYFATGANRIVFYNDSDSPGLRQALAQLDTHADQADGINERVARARRDGDNELANRLEASLEHFEAQVEEQRRSLRLQAAEFSMAKTIHEAVHLLSFNTGLQSARHDYPFWLSEGLAVAFETGEPGSAFGPDHETLLRRARYNELRAEQRLLPLEQFITLADVPDADADLADVMYHQSYALVAHLFRYEREGLAAFLRAIEDESGGTISPSRFGELFRLHFGDPRHIERRIATGG